MAVKYNAKKRTITGTVENDNIRAKDYNYVAPTKGKNKDKGLTIYGGVGNDTLTGTDYKDKFIGGVGENVINVSITENFNDDEIVLTKGEKLTIMVNGIDDPSYFPTRYCKYDQKANNLVITVYSEPKVGDDFQGEIRGTLTVKNYFKKDVIGNEGSFTVVAPSGKSSNVRGVSLTTKLNPETGLSKYTGNWTDELITASGYVAKDKRGNAVTTETEGYEKVKGVYINGGEAIDRNIIRGSIYADTIKGGSKSDQVWASSGNDKYSLGKGENWIGYEKDKKFDNDVITLSKGAVQKIDFKDTWANVNPRFSTGTGKNKNDLIITTNNGKITVKDYYGKDLGARVLILTTDLYEYFDLAETAKFTFGEDKLNKKGVLTTSALADNIDLHELEKATSVKKGVQYGASVNSGAGDDIIKGTDYNDTIKAGTGNDVINAGAGDNKIYFNKGDGVDTIESGNGIDTLVFAKKTNLNFAQDKTDLVISYNDNDKIYLKDYYALENGGHSAKYVQIGKTVTEISTLAPEAVTADYSENGIHYYLGTKNADNISTSGEYNKTTVYGQGGNDTITANGHNTTFYAGKGSDKVNINATGRMDIYFKADDGDLEVNFNAQKDDINNVMALHIEGVTSIDNHDLKFYKSLDNNLIITTPNSADGRDKITIKGFYSNENIPTGDSFRVYYDGDNDYATIAGMISNTGLVIAGTDNADNITLPEGLNTVEPLKGNDTITVTATTAQYQDNIYISKGDGNDTIVYNTTGNGIGKYTQFYFDEGTTVDFEKSGNDLLVNHTKDNSKETVTIKDFNYEYAGFREVFAGDTKIGNIGSLLTEDSYGLNIVGEGEIEGVNNLVNRIQGSNNADTITLGYGRSSQVTGNKGNDVIIFNGNDEGKATGNYKLYFNNGDGDDILRFNNDTFTSLPELHFEANATITAEKDGNNLLIKRSWTDANSTIHTETLTLENYLGHQYTERLWIYKGNNATRLDTYINQNVAVMSYSGFAIGTDKDDTFTVNPSSNAVINLYGKEGNDTYNVNMSSTSKIIIDDQISDGDDEIYGYNTDDSIIYGGNGNDEIWIYGNNDTIVGGKGNDRLSDGEAPAHANNYTLIFNNGDGDDTIGYTYPNALLKFEDSNLANLAFEKLGDNLIIKHNSNQDSVTVWNYYDGDSANYTIQGKTGDAVALSSVVPEIVPEAVITEITGTDTDDHINLPDEMSNITVNLANGDDEFAAYRLTNSVVYGGNGNDEMWLGGSSNDTIYGGKGNDIIAYESTPTENMTLIFNNGDGNDNVCLGSNTLLKFEDSNLANLAFERLGNDLIIKHNSNQDSVTVEYYYGGKAANYTIQGKTGDVVALSSVVPEIVPEAVITEITGTDTDDYINLQDGMSNITINTGNGDDEIYGYNTDDSIIYGGNGNDEIWIYGNNDTIVGGKGNDRLSDGEAPAHANNYTLIFNNGDGDDTIGYTYPNALLKFEDSNLANLAFERLGIDLIIKHNSGKDSVKVAYYYDGHSANYTIQGKTGDAIALADYIPAPEDMPLAEIDTIRGTSNDDYINLQDGLDGITVDMRNQDTLNIQNKAHSALHFAFDIAQNGENIVEDSFMILDNDNFNKWKANMNDSTIAGINIKGNDITAIERIKTSDNYMLNAIQLDTIKSNVASWLANYNDGAYESVSAVIAGGNQTDVTALVAQLDNVNWIMP